MVFVLKIGYKDTNYFSISKKNFSGEKKYVKK